MVAKDSAQLSEILERLNTLLPSYQVACGFRKRIQHDAFKGDLRIVSVTIADDVEEIGYSAFEGCSNLRNIEIPDTVKWIGQDVFKHCRSIKELEVPTSVWEIGTHAFKGCKLKTKRIESDKTALPAIEKLPGKSVGPMTVGLN